MAEKAKGQIVNGDYQEFYDVDAVHGEINVYKPTFEYSNNINTIPKNPNVVKIAVGYEILNKTVKYNENYPNGVMWAFHCEAGKCYLQQASGSSVKPELFARSNKDNIGRGNEYGFICSSLITPTTGTISEQPNYLADWSWRGVPTIEGYATQFVTSDEAYAKSTFRCEQDFWIYWCTSEDVSDDRPYIGSFRNGGIREIKHPTSAVIESNSWIATSSGFSARYISPYQKNLGVNYAKEWSDSQSVWRDSVHGLHKVSNAKEYEPALARMSRDPAEYYANVLIIGDSIVYAGSNAGLQHAWRKYISTRLNLGEIVLAVSGTGIVKDGGAFDFEGNSKVSENYNAELSGYSGIEKWVKSYLGADNSFTFTGSTTEDRSILFETLSMAIVSLGTNDWGNNAPIGSANTLTDETTFYGAVQKTYTLLHDTYKIPTVLFVAPLKRENWNQNNSASTPYTIYDMVHALSEIACINTDMYVLDCTDRWYLDYDNPDIRSRAFIDKVHIKPYAHHLLTLDIAKEIRWILSMKGIV